MALVALILLSIITPSSTSLAPLSLTSPISKDPHTSLYTLSLINNRIYLLDLNGPLLWSPCPRHHPTVPCVSTTCAVAAADSNPRTHCRRRLLTKPGRNPSPRLATCICTTFPINPVTKLCASSHLTRTNLTLLSSPPVTLPDFISSCAPRSLLRSLPARSTGVAGLAQSALSLPAQLSVALSIKPQFAICLPTSGESPGVAFFGERTQSDSLALTYTPLVKNPLNPNYYIKLQGIAVGGELVRFLGRMLEFDTLGHGGAQLSTTSTYTSLRTHIYLPFLRAFARATRRVPRARRVAPHDLCLNVTRLGLSLLPEVDLILPGGKNWTVAGANLMRRVRGDVACLAFVDGGWRQEQAVVVGGFQMEEKLVVFDVERSRVGFSGSLLSAGTACGNFDKF